VPLFHAVQIDYYRQLSTSDENPPVLLQSLSAILQIASVVHETETSSSLCRIAWPLFVAGVESTDFAHQSWVLDRFGELADSSVSFRRAYALLRQVVMRQRQTRERVDYRRWLVEHPELEPFII
jgi:hypothetical protein